MIEKWRNDTKKSNIMTLLKLILDESGYSSTLKNKKDLENENRTRKLKRTVKSDARL